MRERAVVFVLPISFNPPFFLFFLVSGDGWVDFSLLCGEGVCFTMLWLMEKHIFWLQANKLISVDLGPRFLKHHAYTWWTSKFWTCKGAIAVADLELELQRISSMSHAFRTTRAVTQLLVLMSLVTWRFAQRRM